MTVQTKATPKARADGMRTRYHASYKWGGYWHMVTNRNGTPKLYLSTEAARKAAAHAAPT